MLVEAGERRIVGLLILGIEVELAGASRLTRNDEIAIAGQSVVDARGLGLLTCPCIFTVVTLQVVGNTLEAFRHSIELRLLVLGD